MKIIAKFLIPLLVLAIGGAFLFGFLNKRPSRLSMEVRAHTAHPASLRTIANGLTIVDSSIRGRSSTGGLNYQSAFDANLHIHMMWYDILAEQFYETNFDIDVHDLATFGDRADHAAIKILVGPGADVTVTTPHPEGLRLVGLNKMDDITPEMDIPVVVLALCADAVDADPSHEGILMRALSGENPIERAMEKRTLWLSNNQEPTSRCASGENQ